MPFFTCCFLFMTGPALSPGGLVKRIDTLLDQPQLRDGFWGVAVYAPMRDQFLFNHNEDRFFRSASNQKILSTLLAFEYLGPHYRFETRLGHTGVIKDGVLYGDLVVEGGGDPSLSGLYWEVSSEWDTALSFLLAPMLDSLEREGVREIRGDLVGLTHFFQDSPIPPSWEWDDVGRAYGVPISSLMLNDGLMRLFVTTQPGGNSHFSHLPAGAYNVQFQDDLTHFPTQADPVFTREWGSNRFQVRGNLPPCAPLSIYYAAWDPAKQFLAVLEHRFQQRGVQLKGIHRVNTQPQPYEHLAVLQSAPLHILAQTHMKHSPNHHGEIFFRTTTRVVTGRDDHQAGLALAHDFLTTVTPQVKTHGLFDGSGLSARNHLSPLQLIAMLRYGMAQDYADTWLASFPIMGVDGTLENRGLRSTAQQKVYAKTGTLFRTKNLSGYVETLAGEPLIFSIMVNNHSCSKEKVIQTQDLICEALTTLAPTWAVRQRLRRKKLVNL